MTPRFVWRSYQFVEHVVESLYGSPYVSFFHRRIAQNDQILPRLTETVGGAAVERIDSEALLSSSEFDDLGIW